MTITETLQWRVTSGLARLPIQDMTSPSEDRRYMHDTTCQISRRKS